MATPSQKGNWASQLLGASQNPMDYGELQIAHGAPSICKKWYQYLLNQIIWSLRTTIFSPGMSILRAILQRRSGLSTMGISTWTRMFCGKVSRLVEAHSFPQQSIMCACALWTGSTTCVWLQSLLQVSWREASCPFITGTCCLYIAYLCLHFVLFWPCCESPFSSLVYLF